MEFARHEPGPRLMETDDEGFTLVKKRTRPARPDPSPLASVTELRRYRMVTDDEVSWTQAIRRLEEAHPDLRVRITVQGGDIILAPKDETSTLELSRIASEGNTFGCSLQEVESRVRVVIQRYPIKFPLTPILEHPSVTFAKRCTKRLGHGRTEPTLQVEATLRGPFSEILDLGLWGRFSMRRFVPEPLRCFKCHAFGHVQKHCMRQDLCGVCSRRHPTSECISALKEGERRQAKCPNCNQGHHAWARNCPERLRRLPPKVQGAVRRAPREAEVAGSQSAPVIDSEVPAMPPSRAKRRRRRRRRRPRPTPTPPPRRDAAADTQGEKDVRPEVEEAATRKDMATQTEDPDHEVTMNTEDSEGSSDEEESPVGTFTMTKREHDQLMLLLGGTYNYIRYVLTGEKVRRSNLQEIFDHLVESYEILGKEPPAPYPVIIYNAK